MQIIRPTEPAPTQPFRLGPFLVAPQPLDGTPFSRYRITYQGIQIAYQVSRPDLDTCAARALEAANRGAIDAATLRAIRRQCVEAGLCMPASLRVVAGAVGHNAQRHRRLEEGLRFCPCCGRDKPIADFPRTAHSQRLTKHCRQCALGAREQA